ncbi:MAG: HEAT repeat domain-containing protein, partial [Bacteroidota bacterium]
YLGEEEGKKLLQFLSEHPKLSKLAQVPVTLQILCALWKKEGASLKDTLTSSPTALYNKLTCYIWERYKHKRKGKRLQNKDRNKLFQALGQVSLQALEKGEALISEETVSEMLEHVEEEEEMKELLRGSDFLSAVGSKQEFKHLTFQEYFAGKELARMMLKGDSKEQEDAVKFLKAHKYEAHYGVMLSFMAGEVCQKGGLEGIRQFLRALNKDKELGGLQHDLLRLRCLNEWLRIGGKDFDADDFAKLEREFGLMKAFEGLIRQGIEQIGKNKNTSLHDTLVSAFSGLKSVLASIEVMGIYEKALKDKDEHVRRAAVEALGEIGESALPLLEKALGDEKEGVREAAAKALGKIGESALPLLEKALGDKNYSVRRVATMALGNMGAPALSLLEKALEDEDYAIQWLAASAIRKFGKVDLPLPKKESDDEESLSRWAISGALTLRELDICESDLPWLKKILEYKDDWIRTLVVSKLKNLDYIGAPALPLLEKALGDEDKNVSESAAEALGRVGKASLPLLGRVVGHEAEGALDGVVEELSKLEKVPLRLLEKALDSKVYTVRFIAVGILRNLDIGEQALPLLEKALEDEHNWVSESAAYALGDIGTPALPLLEKALGDEKEGVREAAVKALGKVGEPALPLLAKALNDKNGRVFRTALNILKNLDISESALPLLEKALGDENRNVREAAARVLSKLPTKTLIARYLERPGRLGGIIKKKLYKEPLVIRPSIKRGKKELVLYPNIGKPVKWQITDAQAERLQRLFQ